MERQTTIFNPRDMQGERLEMHISVEDYHHYKEAELTDDGYEWVEIKNLDDDEK